jgi:prepilin-type N-terminal cleavage/methylation domain-containing protein
MKKKSITKQSNKGLSLVEILVVITIFAILGIIVSGALILTLRSGRKTESQIRVRENINYSLAVIERNIRNANTLTCPNPDLTIINYWDQNGVPSSFACKDLGGTDPYIASGSARLTSSSIKVVECSFTCTQADHPSVKIHIKVQDTSASGIENSIISSDSEIFLRNY